MRAEKISGTEERRVLTAMVVDPVVLGRISPKHKLQGEGLFASRWANIVSGWCVKYFNEYDKAPAAHVQSLFQSWASEGADKETVALVERFLQGLSDDYESLAKDSNSEYVIDLAATHFNRVALRRLIEQMQGDLDGGKVEKAKQRVVTHSLIEMGAGAGIDVLQDENAIREAFDETQESLIVFPGDMARFFKNAFTRDSFTAILAPEKRGKSWELQDIAMRALLQRRKVAFFSVGDMSQNQMMRRLMIRIAKHPRFKGRVRVPTKITFEQANEEHESLPHVEFEMRVFDENLSWQTANKACKELIQKVKTKESLLKLATYPANSINMKGVEAKLEEWEREGWVADVVVIDYLDIMDDEPNSGDDERSKTNARWKAGRGLSQRRHVALVTATQATAASYTADVISRSNFSEDKRKLAHVTDMYALNQDSREKALGIMRKNWIARREEDYNENHCLWVAGCFKLASPAVRACYKEPRRAAPAEN